jgi:hypothetical protein
MGQHAKHTASSPDAAQVTGMSSREGVEAYKRLPRLMSLLRNAQDRRTRHVGPGVGKVEMLTK